VLGHPHTKAFVSHCGVHSVNEAAFHGVPVVGVPIQFEQVGQVIVCSLLGEWWIEVRDGVPVVGVPIQF
jgi:UDP:flavonoid glycosyltransferase YjiC (YdhE family)